MQCLNIKNPEVAALLKEYTEILGSENAAYYVLSENNGYGIDKAPNGEPSKLFSDLLEHYNGDRVAAIQAKARTYSESFKDWFGDWVNPLKPGDIVFGHPAIGKTYSLESGKYKDKIIDWDVEFNEKRDKWIEDHSNTVKGTPEYKKARNEYLIYPENHPDYVEFLTEEWERVKSKTKKEGKILFASPHNLLKMFPQDFDRIINLKDEDFVKRNIERGGKERESKLWKEGINETISNSTGIPVEYLNENQYFEDYLNEHLGISKVVDENGEPLVVYHHANSPINEFSIEFDNYFSTIKNGTKKALFFTGTANPKKGTVLDREYKFPVFLKANTVIEKTGTKDDLKKQGESFTATINRAAEEADIAIFHGIDDNQELNQDIYVINNPNNVKSIDNQGTFSTQDNNIYNQEAATQNTTGRNKELALLLREIYPNIEIDVLTNPNLRGQAQVEGYMAGRVLLNAVLENQDTLPHEYAHHYVAWFRNTPLVQRGTKQFGSEEALVQAIGENSVKALKWYNRFFNWLKGLFNEKQDNLNEITKAFLSGRRLDNSYFFGKETHNQKAVEVPEAINNVYDKLMSSIHRRMKDIQYSKYTNPNKLDELRALEFRLNQLENDKATLEFIDYMDQDINSALDETLRILSKVKEAAKYGNDHEISNAELDLIKKGYIGFYNNIATNLQNMLDDDTTFDYFNNEQLINDTKVALKRIMGNYAELVRNFNNVVDIIAKDNFIKEATKAGSYTVDQLKNILEEGDLDINLWDQWVGSTQYSNSELVRIMMNKIIAVKNAVADEERIKGKELLTLLDQVDKAKLAYFHEKTKDGHKTGFMTRDLNYGEHYQKLFKYQRDLADKLGFGDKDISEV